MVRVVIVVVVAFAAEVDVVKHDAENPVDDDGECMAGELDRLAAIAAAVNDASSAPC